MAHKLMQVAAGFALLYAARQFYRNWGTTKEECRMTLPGDELIRRPVVVTTEAVWIDAPAGAVWPWLVQMGQDRGGLYSYQTLENFVGLDYHNADRIHPEWQHLAPGDVLRLAPKGWFGLRDGIVMTVVDVTEQQSIVLRMMPPEHLWDAVWSFHLIPHWEDRCRLLIRTRIRLRHPGEIAGHGTCRTGEGSHDAGHLVRHQTQSGTPTAGWGSGRHGEESSSPRGLVEIVSNDVEFAVGLGAKDEPPAGDAQRANSYEVLLHRCCPGKQLGSLCLIDLLVGTEGSCRPFDDHAPALGNTMVVGLEQHVVVDRSADQLGALRRAE